MSFESRLTEKQNSGLININLFEKNKHPKKVHSNLELEDN